MGAIGGLLGLSGGAAGTGFAGPVSAPLLQGVDTGQAGTAYGQTQQGLGSQQALLQALQGQNGLGLQNQAAQGFSNLANGVGPNPAQAQLAQNTAANVAQTGALMAGQRGAAQNVGLLARQAGQQGAATQQQAVGQAATLGAEQQLQGLQGLANQGNTIAGNQIGQTNANLQGQQAQYGNVLNALGAYNTAVGGSQANVNTTNQALANPVQQGQQGVVGGLLNAGGAGLKFLAAAGGGEATLGANTTLPQVGPQSKFGQFLTGVTAPSTQAPKQDQSAPQTPSGALSQGTSNFVQGLGSIAMKAAPLLAGAAKGGMAKKDFREGGKVAATSSSQKASKSGDSYSNDKIPAVLSEHEIVLPRSVTLSADPVGNSAKFVAMTLANRGKR